MSEIRLNNIYQFLHRATALYGDRFYYDNVEYKDNKTTITILCRHHGDFTQLPTKFLSKPNCPRCREWKNLTEPSGAVNNTASFITKAKKVHGDRYNYSNSHYFRVDIALVIRCKEHGSFNQKPSSHFNGHGCPKCGEIQRQDTTTPSLLYYFKHKEPNHKPKWKIGVTKQKNGIRDRYRKSEYINFSNIREWLVPNGKTAYELEQHFLAKYKSDRYYKQILSSGNTELFSCDVLTDEDIAYIESYSSKIQL